MKVSQSILLFLSLVGLFTFSSANGPAGAQVSIRGYNTLGFCGSGTEESDRIPTTNIFVVDSTDPFEAVEIEIIETGIKKMVTEMEVGDLLVIHQMTNNPIRARDSLLAECRPGCPDVGFMTIFSACNSARERSETRRFMAAVQQTLVGIVSVKEELPNSHIIESLKAIGQEHAAAKKRKIFIYSDMVEYSTVSNSNVYMNFFGLSDTKRAEYQETIQMKKLIPSFNNTDVRVFGFGRRQYSLTSAPQEYPAIRGFWQWYFREAGATSLRITNGAIDQ
jgi:hypothetical protein